MIIYINNYDVRMKALPTPIITLLLLLFQPTDSLQSQLCALLEYKESDVDVFARYFDVISDLYRP